MRIKKLEILGFKSFKDRTVIHFNHGITGVVGPNGCGKSNIVDALVWVMGEMSAKHLRGSSMEDVIFAGAEGYSPLGMAEVNLTLENDGGPFPAKYARFSEIMVTRRLHRNGESEYLLNKEPARLRDVQEIFMDTGAGSKGFSIIEQGAIGKIITAKPEDRRTLIEEAAGITKFKVRKRESQRKLTQTDQNLVRLQDIIGEQKRQLDSLQRQAQRAERYRNLKNELKEKDLWFSSNSYKQIHLELEEAQNQFITAQDSDTSVSTEITGMESRLEELKSQVLEVEKEVEVVQTQKQTVQLQAQDLENEIRELKFEIEQARRNKEMTGNILEQYQGRKIALENEEKTYQERVQLIEATTADLEQKFQSENETYLKVQQRIQEADQELTDKRREMLTVSQSESHLDAKLLSLQTQIEEAEDRIENERQINLELESKVKEFLERKNSISSELEGERQLQLSLMNDVENFEENLNLLKEKLSEKSNQVALLKDEVNQVSSRLYGLEDLAANFEGFEDGVKSVIFWQREKLEKGEIQPTQSYAPLSDVVEVPQEYELAMEVSLGARLQMLVSPSEELSEEGLQYLKDNSKGRASFLSNSEFIEDDLEKIKEQLRGVEGVKSILWDVVKCSAETKKCVKNLLGKIVVVENISTALNLQKQFKNLNFVTLDGDFLSNDGVLTGGSSDKAESGVLKRRREIKELSVKKEELSTQLSVAQSELKKLESKYETVSSDLENSKKLHTEKEFRVMELRKDLERADNELKNAELALKKQLEEQSRLEAVLITHREKEDLLKESIEESREKRILLESKVEELTIELKTSREGIDDLQKVVMELKVNSAAKRQEFEGLKHQLAMVSQSLEDVNLNLSKMSHESEKSTESLSMNGLKLEEQKLKLERVIRESEEIQEKLKLVTNHYEEQSALESELEAELSKALHSINQNKAKLNEVQLKLEQLKMKEQYLLDQVFERYQVNLSEEADSWSERDFDPEQTEKEIVELKDKIKRIGEVNLSAIEEYDELSQRYQFLSQQQLDLSDAKENLRKVIDRINRICTRRFKETFELVNERFVKVFPVLFGGGEARLILVDEGDSGELGIDIVAKPPGKKLQNVSLLSGGEKALTAVSLIFSIFLVKPSPYCLLDEVDAPLDDANVFRFNDLVREMAKRSQIIVVTHNKHTMKVADKLYGVTMEEKGVSKMVSVNLHEAERVAEV